MYIYIFIDIHTCLTVTITPENLFGYIPNSTLYIDHVKTANSCNCLFPVKKRKAQPNICHGFLFQDLSQYIHRL